MSMAKISASLVKELRDKTGAGMMDCKKALTETDANVEEAVVWLRKKGLAAAAKKAGRVAAEGLVGLRLGDGMGALVEVNAETDFVSRNESFQGFVATVAGIALETDGRIDALGAAAYPDAGHSVVDELAALVARIGENMVLRRAAAIRVSSGIVAGYVHNQAVDGLGRIGALVALESEAAPEKLASLGRRIAMHVAAARPDCLAIADADAAAVEGERAIFADQARASGKPEEIIEKMVEGRLRKYYEEIVLLEQVWVIDGKAKVKDVIADAAKELGTEIQLVAYDRFALGEGLEREESDFAAEVAAQIAG
jgi:elongation factor Ts